MVVTDLMESFDDKNKMIGVTCKNTCCKYNKDNSCSRKTIRIGFDVVYNSVTCENYVYEEVK